MIVMKFGGSSIADAERIRHVWELVQVELPRKPVVVLSAMGETTDQLLEAGERALKHTIISVDEVAGPHLAAIQELGLGPRVEGEIRPLLEELRDLLAGISLIKELTGRTKDYLVSFGERLSVRIVAAYFSSRGAPARALDSWEAGFLSDSHFTSAELLPEAWNLIPQALVPLNDGGTLPVVTGFIARDPEGNITTLGRGGSDFSATFIAAACGAEEAQVWKDVDGILSADPRLVRNALPVETVTYEEAAELAYFGAQVLHPRAMQPCIKTGIPVLVKNSYNPGMPGTRITAAPDKKRGSVQAITSRKNVTLVDIVSSRMLGQYGFLEEVFSSFAKYHISVDMVATSEVSLSLTLDTDYDLKLLKEDLSKIAAVEIKTGKAIVTIVGDVHRSPLILAQAFGVCADLGIPVQMISQGASKVNISFIVNDTQAAEVVRALHRIFFEKNTASGITHAPRAPCATQTPRAAQAPNTHIR